MSDGDSRGMNEPREFPSTQQAVPSQEQQEARHFETAQTAQGEPTAQHYPLPPASPPHGGRRRRMRGPIGLVAAAALVAAVVGGGAGAYVGHNWDADHTPTASPGTNASSASTNGTVSSVAKSLIPSAVEIRAGQSTGSGVVITKDGEILTNNHVVSGADQIQVRMSDGETKTADVVGTDPDLDMALIKVRDASGLTPAKLGASSKVEVGDQVVAIGSPSGLTGSVTSGIVSALDREVTVRKDDERERQREQPRDRDGWPFEFGGGEYNGELGEQTTTYKAIQTDASINPGNSGGALANMNGEIIGINSAMHSNSSSRSEAGSVGLGFAIPVDDVKKILGELRAGR